ncbi:uncharacterized protein LOC134749730 [Cydia strobilella]|uniref:uncharacterized protein LOC134749730 n=1 Tax=Cydia strobilella TaxID=1100964 RepID=UPI003006E42E
MLPSMPILFTRDSQDAFGNKIVPGTSSSKQDFAPKIGINPEPPPQKADQNPSLPVQNELKNDNQVKEKKPAKALESTETNALDAALVRSYYTKVQSRFSSNQSVPTNKFVQFQSLLKSFDPTKETPVELYRKIEQLFGVEHKDFVEDFLLFLKKGQAVEVGRFSDHLMLMKITNFIQLLQSSLSRKPTVLRKVLRAISSALVSGAGAELKTRVSPHLRAHPKLSAMFKSLFPDERPPDSLYEAGVDTLHESFLTDDKGYDVWTFPEEKYNRRQPTDNKGLDTVYLHGRVFLQHGRMLRAACVTYPYSKEPYRVRPDEPPEPKPQKKKKTPKSPTKNIKDVNDNTKKEVLKSPKKNVKKKEKEVLKREKKDKTVITEAPKPKIAKIEVTATEIKKEIKSNWTREEDKTMLQVLKGEAGSEQVFGRIQESLPHRSHTEIKERFCHVMSLLQEMAVGEVT